MDVFQKFQFQGDLRRFQTELQTNYLFDILYTFEFFFHEYIYIFGKQFFLEFNEANTTCN